MRKGSIINLFLFFVLAVNAQDKHLISHYTFDNVSVDFDQIKTELVESEYAHAGFTSTYCEGLRGKALDLTSDVAVRIPVIIPANKVPAYNKSFSMGIWVKTKPGARQGTVIMSNKKSDNLLAAGWLLGTNDLGAWYFNISDGKNRYDYEPTAERQAVNDGQWHYIAISIDLDKKEGWFYFDGQNVAIYNLDGLSNVVSKSQTVIGGADEYTDWGSRGEWTAFNGMIDEVSLWNRIITPSEIKLIYNELMPQYASSSLAAKAPMKLKTQVWNIWHGGHRFGKHVGVERVIEVLKKENADIIGLIETYGSGAIIADSLGYYFYLISSNLSIMSRYPIENTIKLFKPFYSGGALLDLGDGHKTAFFDIWLSYTPDECELFKGKSVVKEFIKKETETRRKEIKIILNEIQSYIDNADNVPVFVVGDFNSGSHLDWTEQTKEQHFGLVMDWGTSHTMLDSGFKDSFREMNPDPIKDPGFTWSPLINHATPNQNCVRDRIDFIYYKGKKVLPYRSRSIEDHPVFWPSDHGSVVSWFYIQ